MPSLSWHKLIQRISRFGAIRHSNDSAKPPKRKDRDSDKLALESLESRLMLTTIDYTVDLTNYALNPGGLADGDVDLALRIGELRGAAVLELIDLDRAPGGQVVGTAPFTNSIQVNITGSSSAVGDFTEEFPESLVIDFGNNTAFNPAAVAIGVNFDGIKGTAVPLLLTDDSISIGPSSGNVYSPASLNVTLSNGEKISVTGPITAVGDVSLTANDGAIELTNSGSINANNITLTSNANVQANGDADSPDAIAMPSASISVNGGSLTGNDITLNAVATSNVTIAATDLHDGQLSVGGVVAISNSTILIDGNATITASGALSIAATSYVTTAVTRGTQDDGDSTDDDKDQDAAIASSTVTSNVSLQVGGSSILSAGSTANLSAANLMNVTTTADGSLGTGGAGGTLANATVLGDTEVIVADSAAITAGGDLDLNASTSRNVTTVSKATPDGATDDGDSGTNTQGQQALQSNDASTADGDMTLAAAISVGTVIGETRARVNGGTLTSTSGDISITSIENHNVSTTADGTTASGDEGTGVGVAVAVGVADVRSTAAVSGVAKLDAKSVNLHAMMPESLFKSEATSGPSGPSKDKDGNDTGSDVGVAGALAIGVTITHTNAVIEPTAVVDASGSDLNLVAQSTTNSIVTALPKADPVSGSSMGIGASVAVQITDQSTRAAIDDNAAVSAVDDLTITSNSVHSVNTHAEAGAAGGTAIAASVAFGLSNHDTLAQIGSGSTLNTTGNVHLSASHVGSVTTQSAGDAEGGDDAAVGAAFAMDLLTNRTESSVDRSVTAGGSMILAAHGASNATTTAQASAKGEDDDGGNDDANAQSSNQRNSGDSQATSRGARDSNGAGANPDASTSDGPITVAAAIAVNIANTTSRVAIGDGVTIDADGQLIMSSSANSDALATADGSATGGDVGVGAAVAIDLAFINNLATIGNGANVTADGLTLDATMVDAKHTVGAQATSGAGGSDVGVAGSFALSFAKINTEANVQPNAIVTMSDGADVGTGVGPVNIDATSITESTANANAVEGGAGDVGVGASVALNITDYDTRASLDDSAKLDGANDVTLTAKSDHDVITEAKGGAQGGTAITPVVALAFAFHDTVATIGAQNGTMSQTGTLNVLAEHAGLIDTDATGKTEGSDAAIGASLGFTYVAETVVASTERSITTGGGMSFTARSSSIHTTDAAASASGANGEDNNSGGNVQNKTDQQRASGNTQSTNNGGSSSGTDNKATATTADGNDAGSDDDSVTVAAAIAVSIVNSSAHAEIGDGLTIHSGGLLAVRAFQNVDAASNASGEASKGDVGIGAAVAINVADVANQAEVGNSAIVADGIAVEALMTDVIGEPVDTDTFSAESKSGAGGKDVGVAGSLSVNYAAVNSTAAIRSGADVTLADGSDAGSTIGPVSVNSAATTTNTSNALPAGDGAVSDSVGVGASVAVNLVFHHVTAEVEDGVAWHGPANDSVTVDAHSTHTINTEARNGAKGDTGIGAAVAVVISDSHTTAHLGNGTGTIETTGSATIQANQTSTLVTKVSSEANGSDAAVGASVGVHYVADGASATLGHGINASGNVTVSSQLELPTSLSITASAGGGDSDDDSDSQSNSQTNQSNASNNGGDRDVPSAESNTDSANSQSQSESSSSGGSVGVAASIAVNVLIVSNSASISDGADVTSGGPVGISSQAHITGHTQADSTSVDLEGDTNVGAAVAFNWLELTNSATVSSGSMVSGSAVTVEAGTTGNQTNDFTATAFSAAGNKGDTGVAGVAAINVIDAETTAVTADGSSLVSTGPVTVRAEHELRLQAAAASAGFSTETAVGAAVAINVLGVGTGGLRTIASIGDPDSDGPGATVQAGGAVTVDAKQTLGMMQTLDMPESINTELDDPTIAVGTLAIAGGGSSGSVGVAGSVGINIYSTTTHAGIDEGASVGGDSLTISATDSTTLNSVAGSIGIGADGAGIGAGLDLAIIKKDTQATIAQDATVTTDQEVNVVATSIETLLSVSANLGIGNSAGIAGSASVEVVETTTRAAIENGADLASGASVTAGGAVALTASDTFSTKMIAGSVGAASSVGIGAANTTLVHSDTVEASIGEWASLAAGGPGLSVTATSSEDIIAIAAAGGAAGSAAVAGSAVVNVLNENTYALIGRSVTVTADNGPTAGTPGVAVSATDSTVLVSVAGSLAAAGSAAVGIGADVASINKHTQASIESNPDIQVEGNVSVIANSIEDVTSVAAGLAASGGASVAVDASVHVLNLNTRAFIGDDYSDNIDSAGPGNVHAKGNVVVTADDATEIDKVVGVLAVAAYAGIGAGGAVTVIDKTTEAFVGAGAQVTGDGNTSTVTIPTGKLNAGSVPASKFDPNDTQGSGAGIEVTSQSTLDDDGATLSAGGEVNVPDLESMDADQSGKNDLDDDSLTGNRTLSRATQSGFRGVAVTATNSDNVESISIALAGGLAGIAVAAGVNVVDADTRAFVGSDAQINPNTTGANSDQSVQVAAGDDFYQLNIGIGLAGGAVAVTPSVGITVLSNDTQAYLASEASVNAKNDVIISANGSEDMLLVGLTLAGGVVGIGGTVNVLSIDNQVLASIGGKATVFAGGDAAVLAVDDTDIDQISGAAAGGLAGVGASVGVLTIDKLTQATVGDGAHIDALGGGLTGINGVLTGANPGGGNFGTIASHGVVVQARSSEDLFHLAVAGAGGFVGLAGGVAVTLVNSDTAAIVAKDVEINQTKGNSAGLSGQNVYVAAANDIDVTTFAGSLAGGFVGLAGAVDIGSINNDTRAEVQTGAAVAAKHDVEINAVSHKHLEGFTVSGAGGLVGLSAAVSVWSIGQQITPNFNDEDPNTPQQNALTSDSDKNNNNGISGPNAGDDAATRTQERRHNLTDEMADFSKGNANDGKQSNTERVSGITGGAATRLNNDAPTPGEITGGIGSTPVPSGTSAVVGNGATIDAGEQVSVTAHEDVFVKIIVGGFGGGFVGAGASVGVFEIAANTSATSEGTLKAVGSVTVESLLDEEVSLLSLSGGGGLVGLGAAVAIMEDHSTVQAAIGNVTAATTTTVLADANQTLTLETGQITAGAGALGASFTRLTADGSVTATVLGNAQIGQAPGQTVGSLAATADSELVAHNKTVAISSGAVAVSANFALAEVKPTVSATVGANAAITVNGAASVKAIAEHEAIANVFTATGGLGAVGASIATATLDSPVTVAIGGGATIDGGSITLESRFNHDGIVPSAKKAQARADAPSVSVGSSGTGTFATANANADVDTTIGNNATLTSHKGNISVQSFGSHVADADALALSLSLGAALGASLVNATADGNTTVNVFGNVNSGSGVTFRAQASNPATADGESASGGIAAGAAGAVVSADSSPNVVVSLGGNLVVDAVGAVTIEATAMNSAIATGKGAAVGGLDGVGVVMADADANGITQAAATGDIGGSGLIMNAIATNKAWATAGAASGGAGGADNAVKADADVEATVRTDLVGKAEIDNGVTLFTNSTTDGKAIAKSAALAAGVTGGGSTANVTAKPAVSAVVQQGAHVIAKGAMTVTAHDLSNVTSDAGSASASAAAGGAGIATNTVAGTFTAAVHSGTHDVGSLAIDATELATVDSHAVGKAAGGLSLAGAVALNDVHSTTVAEIFNDVFLQSDGDVTVHASDTSTIGAVADQGSGSLVGAVGAGMAFNDIHDHVRASIGSLAQIISDGSVLVIADSDTTIREDGVGISVGAGAGIAGNVAVNRVANDVEAFINSKSTVSARNNLLVQANSDTKLSATAANGAGGIVGVGGTVVVNTFDSSTRAFVDESTVSADGLGTGIAISKWDETTGAVTVQTLHGLAVIASSTDHPASDLDPNDKIPAATVTAFNVAGGFAGISGVVTVNLVTDLTEAFIASSNVNSSATFGSDVIVRAHSDESLMVVTGGVAGGAVGVNGTVDRSSITSSTRAFISDNNETDKDTTFAPSIVYGHGVEVSTVSREKITVQMLGISGGAVALAGTVSVADIAIDNQAFARDSEVYSIDGLSIRADDTSEIDPTVNSVSGGGFAGGAAISVNTIKNTVQSRVFGGQLAATGATVIKADSDESITPAASTKSAGALALAGSVVVNTIEVTTEAIVQSGDDPAGINQVTLPGNLTQAQTVTIAADDTASIHSTVGSDSFGLIPAGASVEVGAIRNRTVAKVGHETDIDAQGDVTVSADSDHTMDSTVIAFSGGAIGLSGAVSVLSLGAAAADTAIDEFSKPEQGKPSNTLLSQTNSSIETQDVTNAISDKSGAPSSKIAQETGDAVNDLDEPSVTDAVKGSVNSKITAAFVEDASAGTASSIGSHGAIRITATHDYDVDQTVGTGAGGLVGVGVSVGVTNITNTTQAYLGSRNTVEADGEVTIRATDQPHNTTTIDTSAGAAGLFAGTENVGIMNLTSTTSAHVGDHAQIVDGGAVTVEAIQKSNTKATGSGFTGGAAAIGAVHIEANVTRTVNADVLGSVSIGTDNDSVSSLAVKATADNTAESDIAVGQGGIVTGGFSKPVAKIEGSVGASVANGVEIDSGKVTVSASDTLSATTNGWALGAGVASGTAIDAQSTLHGNVAASVGDVDIEASGDVLVSATTIRTAGATTASDAVAAIAGGESKASATIDGAATADVLPGAVVTTFGINLQPSVTVQANGTNTATADASATSGGLAAGSAAKTKASINVDVAANLKADETHAAGDVTVLATSKNLADATSRGLVVGILGAAGESRSDATVEGTTRAIASGTITAGDDITVHSQDQDSHANATSIAAGGGFFILSGTSAHASLRPEQNESGPQIQARLVGDATAGGDVEVRAESVHADANASVEGTSLSAGSVGTTTAETVLSPDVSATIGTGSTVDADGNVTVAATNNSLEALAEANSSAGAVVGTVVTTTADAQAHGSATSAIGNAAISAGDLLSVVTLSVNWAKATSYGLDIGLIFAVGENHATAGVGDDTKASILAGATLTVGQLSVSALGKDRAVTDVKGAGGGFVSENSTTAATTVAPTVTVTIGDNVGADVDGDIDITAESRAEGDATTSTYSGGAVAIGSSKATVDLTPTAETTIGENVHLSGDAVTIAAMSGVTPLASGNGISHANTPGAGADGIVGTIGNKATVSDTHVARVTVGTRTTGGPTIESKNNTSISATSNVSVDADVTNGAAGAAGFGHAIAGTDTDNTSEVILENGVQIVSGGDLTIGASADHTAGATATGTTFGAISIVDADTYVEIDYNTKATIGSGASLHADGNVSIFTDTSSVGTTEADTTGSGAGVGSHANDGDSSAELTPGGGKLGVRVGPHHALNETDIGTNASIDGTNVELKARVGETSGTSTSTAISFAFAPPASGSDSDAMARAELADKASVIVQSGATVTAKDTVDLLATIDSVKASAVSDADEQANEITAGADATSITDIQTSSTVVTEAGALLTAHELRAQSLFDAVPTIVNDATKSAAVGGENHKGTYFPVRTVTFDADALLLSGPSPLLIIGLGGIEVARVNIDYDFQGNNIVVKDIVNNDPGKVLLQANAIDPVNAVDQQGVTYDAPASLVQGMSGLFDFRETFESVHIENLSNKDLVINDIDVVNRTVMPKVVVNADTILVDSNPNDGLITLVDGLGFDVKQSFAPTKVEIFDLSVFSSSQLYLDGTINNPIGSTEVRNDAGSVFSGNAQAIIRTNVLTVQADQNVGSSFARLNADLIRSDKRPTDATVTAGDQVWVTLRGILRDPAVNPFVVDMDTISGHGVDVLLRTAIKQTTPELVPYNVDVFEVDPSVNLVDNTDDLDPNDAGVTTVTPTENHFRPDGANSLTVEPLGIFAVDDNVPIDATYSFGLVESSGDITIVGERSDQEINIEAETNVTGSGKINIATNGNVEVTETEGNLQVGVILTSDGDVTVAANSGDIVDQLNDPAHDIEANNITFHSPAGGIGSKDNAFEINSAFPGKGEVNADANGDIFLVEVRGDLNTGVIVSQKGDTSLTTISGAIVDAHNDAALNVGGDDITLDANGGAIGKIGEVGDPLEICAKGMVTLLADAGIPNVQQCGDLKIQLVQVDSGTVTIGAAGNLEIGNGGKVVAQQDIKLQIRGDIRTSPLSEISTGGVLSVYADRSGSFGTVTGGPTGPVAGSIIDLAGKLTATRLDVFGSPGNDQILLHQEFARGMTQVFAGDGNDLVDASALVDRVLAHGGRGNDTVIGGSASDLIWGDEGNDQLSGRGGNDVLSGGDGLDVLFGDDGRDLLFGGLGQDSLTGGRGEDVLVGGSFKQDSNTTTLDALLNAWASPQTQKRRQSLMGRLGLKSSNIIDDRVRDQLTGSEDQDWFLSSSLDVTDRAKNEKAK